jgi:hypothetical protein
MSGAGAAAEPKAPAAKAGRKRKRDSWKGPYPPEGKDSRLYPKDATADCWLLAYLDAKREYAYCGVCEKAGKYKRYAYNAKQMVES